MKVKVKCNCACHTDSNMIHMVACCDNGIETVEISERLDYLDLLKIQDLCRKYMDELSEEEKSKLLELVTLKNEKDGKSKN